MISRSIYSTAERLFPADRSATRAGGGERKVNPNRTVHWTWRDERPPEEIFPSWWQGSWREEGWRGQLWTDADIEESLLARAGRGDPVHVTGPKLLTAHAAGGHPFTPIPTSWIYPMAWDDRERICQARVMSQEELREHFPEAKAIHIWSNSWG